MDRQYISDETAFDFGAKFDCEADVRAYFTVEAQRGMFAPYEDVIEDQGLLDLMADEVIEHRWHCNF